MNTSAIQYPSESWSLSRRGSVETVLSIQGKETDFVCDSSDTEILSDDLRQLEYEPCSDSDFEAPAALDESSGESCNEIISTKVIAVSVKDEGDLEFADSEQTDTEGIDSEVDLCDYWKCCQCGASNNNPLYRYCERCFKVRKSLFPPRPKRKNKGKISDRKDPPTRSVDDNDTVCLSQDQPQCSQTLSEEDIVEIPFKSQQSIDLELPSLSQDNEKIRLESDETAPTLSQDFDSQNSKINSDVIRSCSQDSGFESQDLRNICFASNSSQENDNNVNSKAKSLKRRADSADRNTKRVRVEISSDSDSDTSVSPLVKTISDPSLTVENIKVTKKILTDTVKEIDTDSNMCIVCLSEPKSGVFVHGRIAHICCCYKCAVKVWRKAKRCPVCNCKVSNVLRAVVM